MASKMIKGITVEIGADTTKLDKAINDVDKKTRQFNNELKEVDRIMKQSGESSTLWKQKQELLTKALEESKKKLELLEKSQEQVNEQFRRGEIGEEQYRAFQRELEKARGQVGKYENDLKDADEKVKDLGKDSKNTGDDVEGMGDKAEKSGGKFDSLKVAVGNLISEGFMKLASAAKEAYAEIDVGYDTIITKTGATGASLKELQDVADNVFTSLPVEMSDVGTAVGEVNTRFGSTGEQLEDLSRIFLEYANINGTDVNSSIDEVSAAMKSFGIDASEAADVLGVLTDVSQKTGINTSQLESLLSSNAATFKEMDLSIAEAAQLLGQFEINGVDTATALAALKKAQQNATASGQTMNEALSASIDSIKNASSETEALQTATELFGKKGAAEMTQAIREGRFTVNEFSQDMTGMRQTVEKTFDATQSAPEEMKKSLNALKLELANIANKVLPIVADWVGKFNSSLPKVKQEVEKFKPILETVGGILKTVSAVAEGTFDWLGNVVGATIGYQDHLNDIYEDGIREAKEYRDAIEDQRKSTDELVESTKEQIDKDQSRINKTQELWDKLQELVDQNGNVKKGYEDQAAYIANELSKATDTEIQLVDGKIQKYDELKSIIQDTINMQRAQVVLDNSKALYEEALQFTSTGYADQATAIDKALENSQAEWNRLSQMAYNAARSGDNGLSKVVDTSTLGDFSWENREAWSAMLNEDQWQQVKAAEDSITRNQGSRKRLDNDLNYYKSVITNYETASEEMLKGNYATAEATAAKITSVSRDAYRNIENYGEDTAAAFKDQVKDAMAYYSNQVKSNSEAAEIRVKESIDNAVQYGLENGMQGADLLKLGIIDTLSSIDSFDTEDLKAFMAETGLTLGEILGTYAYESMSGSMLSAVTDLLYSTNNLIPQNINSPGDVAAMVNGYGSKKFASGGYVSNGDSAIVAESGPELLTMVNGAVKVTPLNRQAKNTAIGGTGGKVMYQNITVNANVNNKYDVTKLAEDLALQSKRIEMGRGLT